MKEIKKNFLQNIVKFILGLFLLSICYGYLQSHPAEEISFFSGFKVIFQNAEIFFQNLFGKNGDLLRQKYSLESYYQALISLSEEKPCVDPQLIQELHDTYNQLLTEPKNTLTYTLNDYIQKQMEFDRALRVNCDVTSPAI
ncbi:hypothetical protein FACS1894176_04610 [Bacteroidia bacterium]|nr:hypothetical protein FACS1894176_04610 [Bacteroidia bacterium]